MKKSKMQKRNLNEKDAAEYLTICQRQLAYLRSAGKIKAFKIGRRVAYRIVDLERYAEENLER